MHTRLTRSDSISRPLSHTLAQSPLHSHSHSRITSRSSHIRAQERSKNVNQHSRKATSFPCKQTLNIPQNPKYNPPPSFICRHSFPAWFPSCSVLFPTCTRVFCERQRQNGGIPLGNGGGGRRRAAECTWAPRRHAGRYISSTASYSRGTRTDGAAAANA